MKDNLPKVLHKIYNEDKNRFKWQSEDEVALLKAFETRKADSTYFKMIDVKKK